MSGRPRLLLIADRFTAPDRQQRILDAVRAGARWVQLRDHAASATAFAEVALMLTGAIRSAAPETWISVNTRLAVARRLDVHGHVGTRGPTVAEARKRLGAAAVVGYSAHTLPDARAAVLAGADYVTYSPIYPTASKPDHPGVSPEALAEVCRALAPAPVIALGGITPARVPACLAAGAQGIAVLSGILEAPDVGAAVHAYEERLRAG